MKRRSLPLLVACTASLWVPYAGAADRTAEQWLDLMNHAFMEETYDGIFSYYSGNDLSTLRVIHTATNGVQRERLIHLNGAPREVVRTGDQVACILQPGDEILALESSIPSGPFARAFAKAFEGASDHYRMSLHGTDRVANREAVRVAVMPRDAERYGFRLWIDRDSGLLLRSELIDARGTKLEIFQFATLNVGGTISEKDLTPDTHEGTLTTQMELGPTPAPAQQRQAVEWQAGWVPDGFTIESSDIRRTPSTSQAVNTMMYSDGLAAFSIFVEAVPEAGAANLISRSGATVAVTLTVNGGSDQGNHLVTVVGEIPTATAQKIALSIRHVTN
jgi:sigma-E factor negative regulatory protein RseB